MMNKKVCLTLTTESRKILTKKSENIDHRRSERCNVKM